MSGPEASSGPAIMLFVPPEAPGTRAVRPTLGLRRGGLRGRVAAGVAADGDTRGHARDQQHRGGHRQHPLVAPAAGGDAVGEVGDVGLGGDGRALVGQPRAQATGEVLVVAHGWITSRSAARPRWIRDATVPTRQPSASAMAASGRSA